MIHLSESPGPGAYSPPISKKGPSYTLSSRPTLRSSVDSPGPGAYSRAAADFGRASPAYTLSGRPDEKAPAEVPGPGAYSPPPKPHGKCCDYFC